MAKKPGYYPILLLVVALALLTLTPASQGQEQGEAAECPEHARVLSYYTLFNGGPCAIIVTVLAYDNSSGRVLVNVALRPFTMEEYRVFMVRMLEDRFPLPPRGSNMSIEEYKQYLLSQLENNDTYVAMLYDRYLGSLSAYGLEEVCRYNMTFAIDERNIAEGVGFFPLYSVYDPLPYVVEELDPVYMGKKLGAVGPAEREESGIDTGLAALVEFVDGEPTELYFKRNYLFLGVNIMLPWESGILRLGSVLPMPGTQWFLEECVPDYSIEEFKEPIARYIDLIVYSTLVGLAALAVFLARRWL